MQARYGVDSMAETAENLAEEQRISRADQDLFALASQEKAARAQAQRPPRPRDRAGRSARRQDSSRSVERDEHPRATTLDKLAALPTPFRKGGTVTAGNSSGINDGAAALLLASRAGIERYGLQPMARIAGLATAGVAPRIMGIGPVPATQKLLEQARSRDRRFRCRRAQRGFRRPVARLPARPRPARRCRTRQSERRRDRARPSARHVGRAPRAYRGDRTQRSPRPDGRWPPCASASARASRWRSSGSVRKRGRPLVSCVRRKSGPGGPRTDCRLHLIAYAHPVRGLSMKVALVQMNSGSDKAANLAAARA